MHLWELLSIIGIAFLILRYLQINCHFVFSFVSFFFLRPILVKRFCRGKETGVQSKYIGKIAKAEEDVTEFSGVISIYGERWEARSEHGNKIPKGSEVKIERNESIIMYVSEYKSV